MNSDKFQFSNQSYSASQQNTKVKPDRKGIYTLLIIILLLLLLAAGLIFSSSTFIVPNFVSNQALSSGADGSVSGVSINGTEDRVIVLSDDGGNLTLLTPQPIASTSSPIFNGLTLSNLNGNIRAKNGVLMVGGVDLEDEDEVQGVLGAANGGTGVGIVPVEGQILVGDGNGGYTLKTIQAGSNITVTNTGTTLMISSTASGGGFVDDTDDFVQNGNSFGTLAVLGTNDNYGLAFETAGIRRGAFDALGNFEIGPNGSPLFTLNTNGLAVLNSTLSGNSGNAMRINHAVTGITSASSGLMVNSTLNNNINVTYNALLGQITNSAGSQTGFTVGVQGTITNNGTTLANQIGVYGVINNNGSATGLLGLQADILAGPLSDAFRIRGVGSYIRNENSSLLNEFTAYRGTVQNYGESDDRSGTVFNGYVDNYGLYSGVDTRTANFDWYNYGGGVVPEFYGLSSSIFNWGLFAGTGAALFNQSDNHDTGVITLDWIGFRSQMENRGIIGRDYIGYSLAMWNNASVSGDVIGMRLWAQNATGATANNLYGLLVEEFPTDPGTISGNHYGIYIGNVAGGSINNYGIFLEGVSGGSSNDASLWVDSGLSRFAPATDDYSSIRLASSGGLDPLNPVSGDLWWNGTQLYFYNGSSAINLLAGGGSGTPGGSDGAIQFNDGGTFGGSSLLFWDDTNGRLGVGTDTPGAVLTVQGDFNSTAGIGLELRGTNSNGSFLNIFQEGALGWGVGMDPGSTELSFRFNHDLGGNGIEVLTLGSFSGTYAPPGTSAILNVAGASEDRASINLAVGIDPGSPQNGDLWWNGAQLYFNNGSTNINLLAGGGGSGTPEGGNGSIQFNNGGVFGGSSFFLWDDGNNSLLVGDTPGTTGIVNIAGSKETQAAINFATGVDLLSPSAGDLWWNGTNLYFNDGANNIDLLAGGGSGGGSGSGIYTKWDHDAPPVSPNPMDDEFNDGSFDSGLWSEYNFTGVPFDAEDTDTGLRIFWNGSPGFELGGIYQEVQSEDFTYVTKVQANTEGPITFPGLALMEDATDPNGDMIYAFIFSHYDNESFQVHFYEDYQANGEDNLKERQIHANTLYIRARYNFGANELYIDYSFDGITYSRFITVNPSFSIQHVGLLTRGEGGDISSGFQFFRADDEYHSIYEPTYGRLIPQGGGGSGGGSGFVEFEPGSAQVATSGNPLINLRYEGTTFSGDALINIVNGDSSDFPYFMRFAEGDGGGGDILRFEVDDFGNTYVGGSINIDGVCGDNDGADGGNDGCDVAETFASNDDLEPGELVKLDPNPGDNWRLISRTTSSNDQVIGVISTNPTLVMGNRPFTSNRAYPVGLTGVLPTKVVDQNGLIKRGDYVTVSDTPGHGMKANPGDATVGIALESQESPTDTINVLISRNNLGKTIAINEESIDLVKLNLALSLTDLISIQENAVVISGKLQVDEILAGSVETSNFKVNSNIAGEVTLPTGVTEHFVSVGNISDNSKVLVSPTTQVPSGVTYWTEKVSGGFNIKLNQASGSEIKFNYFVIN